MTAAGMSQHHYTTLLFDFTNRIVKTCGLCFLVYQQTYDVPNIRSHFSACNYHEVRIVFCQSSSCNHTPNCIVVSHCHSAWTLLPSSLHYFAIEGGDNTSHQMLEIRNSGVGTLCWESKVPART